MGRRDVLFADRSGPRSVRRDAGQRQEGQAGHRGTRWRVAVGAASSEKGLDYQAGRSTSRRRTIRWLRHCWRRSRPAPSEIFRTAQLLLEAGRPELAKGMLKKILDARLDDGQWTALVDEFHTPAFTGPGRPEAKPNPRRRFDPRGPQRRQSPLARPGPQSPSKSSNCRIRRRRGSHRALAALQGARGAGVDALIAVLADPQRAAEYDAVRAALVAMRGDAIDTLADIIERAEPDLMIEAIETLAQMRATQATVYLFVPALSEESDVRVRAPGTRGDRATDGSIARQGPAAKQLYDLAEASSPANSRCGSTSMAA